MNSERVIGLYGSSPTSAAMAEAAAATGFVVEMLDAQASTAKQGRENVVQRLAARVRSGGLSRSDEEAAVARLRLARNYESFANAECVVESAPVDLATKRRILSEIEQAVSPRTLLASNGSLFSVAQMSERLRHPDRFLGMHPVNPEPIVKVVELVRAPSTSEQAMVDGRAICVRLGTTPVKVQDSPGFIGGRVSRPLFLEAQRLVETGEADIRSVDRAMREIGGLAKGPFELMDQIGLGADLALTESIHRELGGPAHLAPGVIQKKLVAAGHLGRGSGRGFYDYAQAQPAPAYETTSKDVRAWKATRLLGELGKNLGRKADRSLWVYGRIFLAVVNEAARVADSIALPRDVNLVMQLGYGFAEGPLAAADHVGLDLVQGLLAEFFKETGGDQRFTPNALLDRLVKDGDLGEKAAKGFLHHSL